MPSLLGALFAPLSSHGLWRNVTSVGGYRLTRAEQARHLQAHQDVTHPHGAPVATTATLSTNQYFVLTYSNDHTILWSSMVPTPPWEGLKGIR